MPTTSTDTARTIADLVSDVVHAMTSIVDAGHADEYFALSGGTVPDTHPLAGDVHLRRVLNASTRGIGAVAAELADLLVAEGRAIERGLPRRAVTAPSAPAQSAQTAYEVAPR